MNLAEEDGGAYNTLHNTLHKESLWSLQTRPEWNNKCRNFQKGNIMLLKTEANRNQWPMTKVIGVNADELGLI